MTTATVEKRQTETDNIYSEVFGASKPVDSHVKGPVSISKIDDQTILEKAKKATNGSKFSKLYDGDSSDYPSPSEADQALSNMLAFWCKCDPAQMDRIFKSSGLYREKWDKKHFANGRTYGEATIQNAIDSTFETYSKMHTSHIRSNRPQKQGSDENSSEWEIITLENIYSEKLEEKPIIKGLLYEQESTVIYSPGGVGKSLVTQDIAMALGTGFPFLWKESFEIPKSRHTLFVQSENSRLAVHQRSFLKCSGNQDYRVGLKNVTYASQHGSAQVAGHVSSEEFRNELINFAKRAEQENEFKIEVIVFDPLISYHDADENDNSRMRTTLDCLFQISNEIDATAIVVHHANKGLGIRGASAIYDWARNVIKLEDDSNKGERHIKFTHEKCNNTKKFEPFVLAMDEYLNFSPIELTKTTPKKEKERGLKVKEALKLLGGSSDTKGRLANQYSELTGIKSRSTNFRHIDEAVKNGFISSEIYEEGNLKKTRYLVGD